MMSVRRLAETLHNEISATAAMGGGPAMPTWQELTQRDRLQYEKLAHVLANNHGDVLKAAVTELNG